jgi:hypothetical protein
MVRIFILISIQPNNRRVQGGHVGISRRRRRCVRISRRHADLRPGSHQDGDSQTEALHGAMQLRPQEEDHRREYLHVDQKGNRNEALCGFIIVLFFLATGL